MEFWLYQYLIACAIFAGLLVVMWVMACIVSNAKGTNAYEKGVYRSVGITCTTIMAISMWLMYSIAYLHQVYPMITPDYENPDVKA